MLSLYSSVVFVLTREMKLPDPTYIAIMYILPDYCYSLKLEVTTATFYYIFFIPYNMHNLHLSHRACSEL